ncbi:MAG: B12-binding domain-containing protein [Isosphaeraceae bacterium]
MSDAARIVREGDFPRRDLSRLGLPANADGPGDPRAASALVFDAMRRGAAEELAAILLGEFRSGRPVEALADAIVAPAMRRIGREWAEGRMLVWQEHRATQTCVAALHELRAAIVPADDDGKRPMALGGGPEGDPYAMANLLAELALASHGWKAVNLGPNTPLASLRAAVAQLRPRLVWISASHLADTSGFLDEYRALYREAEKLGTAVAIGGPALTPEMRAQMPCSTHGESITHLIHFARALKPPTGRPRRGRPRSS